MFACNRDIVQKIMDILRRAAGYFYIDNKSTGSVQGQQPFGGLGLQVGGSQWVGLSGWRFKWMRLQVGGSQWVGLQVGGSQWVGLQVGGSQWIRLQVGGSQWVGLQVGGSQWVEV